VRSNSDGSVGDSLELSVNSGVSLVNLSTSTWLAHLGVPLLLDVKASGVDVSLVLGVLSLSLLNVSDGVDSGVFSSVLDLHSSLLGSDLDLVLLLSGELGNLLLAHLELSSDSVQLLLVEVSSDLDLPEVDSSLVALSPVLESESSNSGSGLDVLASAGSSLLNSDHLLSLGAPLELLLNSDDLSLLGLDLLVDLSFVDFHVGLNLNSLGDVLPLETLVGLVDFSLLEALTVSSSLEAVVLAVVSFEGSADGSVSTLVSGFDGSDAFGWGIVILSVLINLLLLDWGIIGLDWSLNNLWVSWSWFNNNVPLPSKSFRSALFVLSLANPVVWIIDTLVLPILAELAVVIVPWESQLSAFFVLSLANPVV
jgi:hypothetical protein